MKAPLALVALAVALAACAVTPPSPSPAVTASPPRSPASLSPSSVPSPSPYPVPVDFVEVPFDNGTFMAPASWHVLTPRIWTAPVGPLLFLSDAPIADPCPTEARAAATDCWKPLATLPPGSILVTFAGSGTLQLANPTPKPSEIAPQDWCAEIGGDHESVTRFPGYVVSACLRGPDTATNQALFAGLVASLAP